MSAWPWVHRVRMSTEFVLLGQRELVGEGGPELLRPLCGP